MKIFINGKYETLKCWAFGLFVQRLFGSTLVVMVGTSWKWGLSKSDSAFALMLGPVSIAGAK